MLFFHLKYLLLKHAHLLFLETTSTETKMDQHYYGAKSLQSQMIYKASYSKIVQEGGHKESNFVGDEILANADTSNDNMSGPRNTIKQFDNAISLHNKDFCTTAWLHIPPRHEVVKESNENSSYLQQLKRTISKILIVFELVTLFKYFVRLPILNIFIPDGTPKERRYKRIRALSILGTCALAAIYGCYVVLRYCNWDPTCLSGDWQLRVLARLSGKLVTFFVIIGLVLTFRAITSYFHEISSKVGVGWRKLHIDCFIIAMVCAVVHTFAHTLRILRTFSNLVNWSYENYFICTGVVLWIIFMLQYMSYFVLRFIEKLQIANRCILLTYAMKWLFRHSHLQLFKVFALFYFFHASGDISPFAIYVVWLFCENQFQLQISDCTVRFTPCRQNYEYCEVITTYVNKIPDEFGYYCRVSLLNTFSCYTLIPLEDGRTAVFKIKKCVQSDKLLNYINESHNGTEGLISKFIFKIHLI